MHFLPIFAGLLWYACVRNVAEIESVLFAGENITSVLSMGKKNLFKALELMPNYIKDKDELFT